ncbi:unnamed protein product [Tetraodon nigroviridis]|uniref:Chromosome 15 SCAF14992, whole genome shotgun sequence n=1 Tax=Tetraodon nigroviridis TaxID=99883 RepID=Q4RVK4_TETNG|nr:unnamed protein product [Tetraodon nigroviridis]
MESTGGSAAAPAKHSDSSVGEIEMVAMQMETEGHPPENGFVSPETTTPGAADAYRPVRPAVPRGVRERPTNNGTRGEHVNNNGAYGSDSGVDGVQCNCSEWKFKLHTGLVQNVVTKWSLVCKSASEVHIAKFALVVGSSFGYLVFGILADWFGRHPMLITSVLFMLAFGLSVAFSINVPMFSILRFFEGFSLAGIVLSLYLLSELNLWLKCS